MDIVRKEFDVNIPIEDIKWNVGLIVGASGTGKTTIARQVFKDFRFFDGFEWAGKSIIDDFGEHSAKDITEILSKVGFASPPDWLKPFNVLSNGQKMRAELARLILEAKEPFIYDEFTSVVDRQVACIGSAAIQKFIRKQDKQFIAVSCHYDIEEWLEPDWVFDCRGLGARQEWKALRGVRGEVIRLHAPEVTLQRPTRLIHPRYPIYIAPKPDHVFVIGATEIETEDLSPASVRSTLELLSAAYTVHSGFAEARILEISTQARPTLANNLPAIRQLGARTLQINGLYRHGFLIAPAMLDIVLEWVQSRKTTLAGQFALKFEHV
jgi:ABC-type polar amino acid transport system ATPase subunit